MTVARRLLADHGRAFLWWSLGMVILVGSTVGLWPSIRGQEQFEELMRDLPETLRALFGGGEGISFVSPPGYLQSRLFSLLLPALLLVFGIGVGARSVGGAEEKGTLELVLAHPVSRRRLVAERYAAMVGLLVALTVVALLSLAILGPSVGLLDGLSVTRLLGRRWRCWPWPSSTPAWPLLPAAQRAGGARPSPWPARWRWARTCFRG